MKALLCTSIAALLLTSCRSKNPATAIITSPKDVNIGQDLLKALGGNHFLVQMPKELKEGETIELVFRNPDSTELTRISTKAAKPGEILRVVFIQKFSDTHSRVALIGSEFTVTSDIEQITGSVGYGHFPNPRPLGKTLFTIQTSYEVDAQGEVPYVEVFLRLSESKS